MPLLFVYGTLKDGYRNNIYLRDERFIGAAETEPYYRMYENGMFPMIVKAREGYPIYGEIWKVSREALHEIDLHELFYDRKQIDIAVCDDERVDGKRVWAYFYKNSTRGLYECEDGFWPA